MTRITKLMDPAEAYGEYIGATLIEARAADALADALEATWRRDPDLYYEDGYQTLVDTGGEVGVGADRGAALGRGRQPRRPRPRPGDRVPLLARMLLSPLFIDIRAGAVSGLGDLLSDRRISSDGHVAVAVGPGQGERLMEAIQPALANADVFTVRGGSLEAAGELQAELRGKNYDALVGIGGGRTLDVAKYAATRLALPMVAVATNLAHDGIASPVSSLLHEGGKGSFGVGLPMAVVVDLDYVRASPPRMVRSGIGDVVSATSPRSPTGSSPAASGGSRSTAWR